MVWSEQGQFGSVRSVSAPEKESDDRSSQSVGDVPNPIDRVLISLQSIDELKIVGDSSFRWLDLKDPTAGSLGCPTYDVADVFISWAEKYIDRNHSKLSIALGEFNDWFAPRQENTNPIRKQATRLTQPDRLPDIACQNAINLLDRFDFAKLALSETNHCPNWLSDIQSKFGQLIDKQKLILVYYADESIANAPSFHSVLTASIEMGCRYILIDTYAKQRGRLWDWKNHQWLTEAVYQAHQSGLQVALAGSLKMDEFEQAMTTGADVVGFRTALCKDSSRVSSLCCDKLKELQRRV